MSKSNARATTAPRGIVAPPIPSEDPPLVPFRWIQDFLPHVGEVRLREAMRAPSAPRPVLGGGMRSRALWSRDAVVRYFDDIAKSGVWPVAEREAA
ncbi:hypothetical protein QTI17_17210 [Variovorax sp. J31P179]|uniref:hypothetical protein n=1 Tax=Variovorax sp. J31P179 TaxID=3053508 RepID=UPI002577A792|nr:hypothetical protein [Variovorax sp. J31P179]MDM0082334.1 hypothetical protein [Variovorax sp. J31P179]